MRVFDAKPHLYCNNVSVEPWEQGPSADVVQRRATDTSPLFVCIDDFLVVSVVVNVDFALLLPLSLLLWLFCTFLGCLRSYNCCIDINLWSLLFQTTPFVNSPINQSSPITKPHPPPVFIAPRIYIISKNGVFIPEKAIFQDFPPFFARSSVKYQPIFKWFSLSDSPQQALQHCRSKFVAKQTSLHQNNYRNFFTGHSVSVR